MEQTLHKLDHIEMCFDFCAISDLNRKCNDQSVKPQWQPYSNL